MLQLRQFSTNVLSHFIFKTTASLFNFTMNGGMSIFHILRVFSMGHELFLILDFTFSSSLNNSSNISALYSPSFEYVLAEKILYLTYFVQGQQVMMTSSMRHFVKHNCDHIFITEGHYSFIFAMVKFNISPKNFDYFGALGVRARISSRAKRKKCSKSSQTHFPLLSGHRFKHLK